MHEVPINYQIILVLLLLPLNMILHAGYLVWLKIIRCHFRPPKAILVVHTSRSKNSKGQLFLKRSAALKAHMKKLVVKFNFSKAATYRLKAYFFVMKEIFAIPTLLLVQRCNCIYFLWARGHKTSIIPSSIYTFRLFQQV